MLNSLRMARPTASAIPGSRPIVRTPSVVTIERNHSTRARRNSACVAQWKASLLETLGQEHRPKWLEFPPRMLPRHDRNRGCRRACLCGFLVGQAVHKIQRADARLHGVGSENRRGDVGLSRMAVAGPSWSSWYLVLAVHSSSCGEDVSIVLHADDSPAALVCFGERQLEAPHRRYAILEFALGIGVIDQ